MNQRIFRECAALAMLSRVWREMHGHPFTDEQFAAWLNIEVFIRKTELRNPRS